MTSIVDLDEAKAYCRIRHDSEDDLLEFLINAATEAVLAAADDWEPDEEEPAPDRLRLAILARVEATYHDRSKIGPAAGEERLIFPLRRIEI